MSRSSAGDLRLACMRISRRVRFESTAEVAPHQFSRAGPPRGGARAPPSELADIEKVSAPSMTRTVAALVERGLVERADDPTDGRQVILSLTPEGRAHLPRHPPPARPVVSRRGSRQLTAEERTLLAQATAILLERVAAE